ncbi:hypothetical protein VTN31DRAFT_2916 [Thermomyces dupontii]|uniref:uncharacterized protein n=1 Tax=Talaromyces thermophilus TaxID=28565 RepID=UPI0037435186
MAVKDTFESSSMIIDPDLHCSMSFCQVLRAAETGQQTHLLLLHVVEMFASPSMHAGLDNQHSRTDWPGYTRATIAEDVLPRCPFSCCLLRTNTVASLLSEFDGFIAASALKDVFNEKHGSWTCSNRFESFQMAAFDGQFKYKHEVQGTPY